MLLKELSEAFGVSGHEEEVRGIILREIRDRVDSCTVDGVGNLIAEKRGTGGSALKVLLAAHMDEVGLMVSQVEDAGHLRFYKVGGIDDRVLPGKAVRVGDRKIPGVIGIKPPHLLEKNERDTVPGFKQLAIDIGAGSRAEAERLVQRGDYAVFASELIELQSDEPSWMAVQGKAFDDRAGCAVLIGLLKERLPFDLVAAFTVQEEVGLRGARAAAYTAHADCAFVLECTGANEIPTDKDVSPSTRIGQGPAITVMDSSFIADKRLVSLLMRTADEKKIPFQVKQPNIGGTDAGAIHVSRGGVPSVTVAMPCRYIHSPSAIMCLQDLERTTALMAEALKRLPGVIPGGSRARSTT